MKAIYYLYVEAETNRILNATSYEVAGYTPVMLESEKIPGNILNKCYELMNGALIYHEEWDECSIQKQLAEARNEIEMLREQVNAIKQEGVSATKEGKNG